MSEPTILFVDDERMILDAMSRQLRKKFPLKTAEGGDKALELLAREGPVAVVVSDMRMPEMDGVQLLSKIKETYPDTVRIMLTGNADLQTAIEAVNCGEIYRFLLKPCSVDILETTLRQAVRQYQLITAERELLDKTLKGSIDMLGELLSLANPAAFACGYRIRKFVRSIAGKMHLKPLWQFEIAALLSQVGCVTVPVDVLRKVNALEDLTDAEWEMFARHPEVGAKLVGKIPRLAPVAAIIRRQLFPWSEDEEGASSKGEEGAIGGHLLHVAMVYDRLRELGNNHAQTMGQLYRRGREFHPDILEALADMPMKSAQSVVVSVAFDDILPGMVADEDICAKNGTLIIPRGQEVSWPVLQELENFISHIGIKQPVRMRVPRSS